jgi:cell division protein FtsZ
MGHLVESVDTLITIPNERLLSIDESLTIKDAFRLADRVLSNAVRGISDLITIRGDINVDFADVRTIMTTRGRALMGTGYGTGARRAVEAAEMAINSPLLEDVSIDGAMGILINITGGTDLTMKEVSEAVTMIEDSAHEDAHIIFGYVTIEEPVDEVKITVIATGFPADEEKEARQRGALHTMANSGYMTTRATDTMGRVSSPSASRISETPEQVQVPSGGRVSTVRHTITSESDLDTPAFIRKQFK